VPEVQREPLGYGSLTITPYKPKRQAGATPFAGS
jgi:hypothetical protein